MTFAKKQREMEKKQRRADKLARKHDRTDDVEKPELPDPFAVFKEYEAEHGTGTYRPDEDQDQDRRISRPRRDGSRT